MNTYACFIFLLAIGLSAQKTEFEIDFEEMVNTVRLKDNRTLLNCTEKCNEVKEAACKCLNFTCLVKAPHHECIKAGLQTLNLTRTEKIIMRMQVLNLTRYNTYQRITGTMSPKRFLNNIEELYQMSNAETL